MEVCAVKARAEACEPVRRGRQDIIMDILTIAKHGARKTQMIGKVRMSSAQCAQYLEDLKGVGYISEESGTWKTTEKGLQVVDACKICHNLMNMT